MLCSFRATCWDRLKVQSVPAHCGVEPGRTSSQHLRVHACFCLSCCSRGVMGTAWCYKHRTVVQTPALSLATALTQGRSLNPSNLGFLSYRMRLIVRTSRGECGG